MRGELYEVDDRRLAVIDRLESVGKPGNYRVLILVEPPGAMAGGQAYAGACLAYAYAKSRVLAMPVHTDWLENYDDRRFVPLDRRG